MESNISLGISSLNIPLDTIHTRSDEKFLSLELDTIVKLENSASLITFGVRMLDEVCLVAITLYGALHKTTGHETDPAAT